MDRFRAHGVAGRDAGSIRSINGCADSGGGGAGVPQSSCYHLQVSHAQKVLLIDYEPRSVDRMRSLLDGPEYVLTVAKDGEEGLSVFSSASFDLVLLAGMLPRLPSAEVIREIRRKGGATAPPILLMVSGYHGTNPKADAQRVGAFDIVPRPFSDVDFRNALRNAIEATDIGARTMRIPTARSSGGVGA